MAKRSAFTIRHGELVVHAQDAAGLEDVVVTLRKVQAEAVAALRKSPSDAEDSATILDAASAAANVILNLLTHAFHLKGAASTSLGTALRVSAVRKSLAGQHNGHEVDIVRALSYVAAAADAQRHLTEASIESSVLALRKALADGSPAPRPAVSVKTYLQAPVPPFGRRGMRDLRDRVLRGRSLVAGVLRAG